MSTPEFTGDNIMQGNYTNCLFQIDRDNGVITVSSHGIRLLRITHLPDPVPQNVSIDIVALPALTSYTPIRVEVKHVESFQEWIDDNIEPVDELDSSGVTDEYVNKELGPE